MKSLTCLLLMLMPPGFAFADPATELIHRIVPKHADQFVVETIPVDKGKDVFEIESQNGKIVLRGNSPLSVAVGLNWYLKYTCHCHVSLNGNQLTLPDQLPVVPEKVRRVGWAPSRYFLNYCTFSYSMVWWDWTQWEFFIDWMALNGINQPLAVTGQEAVWQAVGRRFGMTDAEIDDFLAGPPYLPFQWMGCLDSHGGPLPKDWIPQHVELERKILARERALGMTPVLQGFTGHIPEAILKKYPGTKAQHIQWVEFNTWMLDPTDPLFQKMGTAFIEEQTRLFGTDHLYAADSFIEMRPPSGDLTYLANAGRAIYEGMAKADPEAVWLLQGWTFMHQDAFWKPDRIKAFLDAVPDERMLILDLYCERRPMWNKTQGFYGKPWNWSFIYNFGNRVEFPTASLAAFDGLDAARHSNDGQNIQGVGLMMEGFGHHPMIFDLMFELAWREGKVDRAAWMKDYIHRRYGQENEHATRAWNRLLAGPYARTTGCYAATFTVMIPSDNPPHVTCPEASPAWSELLKAAPALGHNETFRCDLVFVARQALNDKARALHGRVMVAWRAKDIAAHRQAVTDYMQLMADMDELLGTDQNYLLGPWLEDAKRWGGTEEERAKLEWNARRVLTLWGNTAQLRDYSRREWSGLFSGFYAKRWKMYFDRQTAVLTGSPPPADDSVKFENDWCNQRETYPSKPTGDSLSVARRLYEKYCPQPIHHLAVGKPVTCSFALPGMDASFANDGLIDTESYWGTDLANDKASWWRVDFEKPTKVGRVVVVGYHGDNRHYGFTIEGSLDGREWTMLADRRDNKEPSTKTGCECKFTPRDLRYLRVTLTGNSANTGRHLVEVLAF